MKTKKELKNQKAITLIALVITIVVLLILAGVTIASLTGDNGILTRTNEAKQKTKAGNIQEQIDLWKTNLTMIDNINMEEAKKEFLDKLEKEELITNEERQEIEKTGSMKIGDQVIVFWKITIAEKVKDGTIKIGDYVAYVPSENISSTINEEINQYSGFSSGEQSISQEKLNWRVFDITNDGNVRLISENPTNSKIRLNGYDAYNNIVYLVDKSCKELYSNNEYSIDVKNLKINDIEEKINVNNFDYREYANANVDTKKYGGKKEYNLPNSVYPSIFAKERNSWIEGISVPELDLSEQKEPIVGKVEGKSSITITQTCWIRKMDRSDFIDEMYYNLLIGNGENDYQSYWLSSRSINAYPNEAIFNTRFVTNGSVTVGNIFRSNGQGESNAMPIRPIVTLNSEVAINMTDDSKNGDTVDTAWIIE